MIYDYTVLGRPLAWDLDAHDTPRLFFQGRVPTCPHCDSPVVEQGRRAWIDYDWHAERTDLICEGCGDHYPLEPCR